MLQCRQTGLKLEGNPDVDTREVEKYAADEGEEDIKLIRERQRLYISYFNFAFDPQTPLHFTLGSLFEEGLGYPG